MEKRKDNAPDGADLSDDRPTITISEFDSQYYGRWPPVNPQDGCRCSYCMRLRQHIKLAPPNTQTRRLWGMPT